MESDSTSQFTCISEILCLKIVVDIRHIKLWKCVKIYKNPVGCCIVVIGHRLLWKKVNRRDMGVRSDLGFFSWLKFTTFLLLILALLVVQETLARPGSKKDNGRHNHKLQSFGCDLPEDPHAKIIVKSRTRAIVKCHKRYVFEASDSKKHTKGGVAIRCNVKNGKVTVRGFHRLPRCLSAQAIKVRRVMKSHQHHQIR